MYSEALLIERIHNATGYNVKFAEDRTQEFVTKALNSSDVRVYVGHIGVRLENPSDHNSDGYSEIENPQILLTSVQFICPRVNLPLVRTNIYNACMKFTPFPNDENYSSLSFIEGTVIAMTGERIFWQDIYSLVFPRIS